MEYSRSRRHGDGERDGILATDHFPTDPWPPDDTEESVVGTGLHQMTIINLRWGIDEVAYSTCGGKAL